MNENEDLTRKDWARDDEGVSPEHRADVLDDVKPLYTTLTRIGPDVRTGGLASYGVAQLKRITMVGDVEQIEVIVVPITTARVDSTRRKFKDLRAPIPPMKDKLITVDSEEGKGMGLTSPRVCEVAVIDDPRYQRQLEEYNEKILWATIAEAIDVPLEFKNSEGEVLPAKTTSEKVDAIKQAGFTEAQIMEMARAIGKISHWTEEERRRFLGEN